MNPVGRAPGEFDEVFFRYDALPIVGGQAVYLWADAYHAREPRLAEFHPFVSKDADLFGHPPAVSTVAPLPAGWQISFYSEVRQTAVALLTKKLPSGGELRVDVMRAVYGVSEKDLSEASFVEIGQGKRYRLRNRSSS